MLAGQRWQTRRVRRAVPECGAKRPRRTWPPSLVSRVRGNLAGRVNGGCRGQRAVPYLRGIGLLGATVLTVMQHLEWQFKAGMTWANYGTVWEIDHIWPCAFFDLRSPLQQECCFSYLNLQPMLKSANRSKGARRAGS